MTGGFAAIPVVWMDDYRLTSADVLVIAALSSWLGCDEVRPSHATIAKRAHVSEKTCRRSLDHLRELNLVSWQNRRREDGGQTSNVYQIHLPTTGGPSPTVGEGSVMVTDPPGQTDRAPLVPVTDEVPKREVPKRKEAERPLPEDWQPNDKHRAMAEESGVEIAVEAAKFRSHAEMHDRRAARWDSAFNYWLINAAKFAAENGRRTTREPASFSPWSQ